MAKTKNETSYHIMLANMLVKMFKKPSKVEVKSLGFAGEVTNNFTYNKQAYRKEMRSSTLAMTSTISTGMGLGGLLGGSLLTKDIEGPEIIYNSLGLGEVGTGAAILGLGMFVAGSIDILDQCRRADKGTFFQLRSFKEFLLKLVTTLIPISSPLSACYLIGHAIIFLGYFLKTGFDLCCNSDKLDKDIEELSDNFRSICFNLAAIALFPSINAIDLFGGILQKIIGGVIGLIKINEFEYSPPNSQLSYIKDNENSLSQ